VQVDADGQATVVGQTASSDFAGMAAAVSGDSDAFLIKVSSDGSRIVTGQTFGGSSDDFATGVASDGAGGSLVDAGNPHGRVAVYPAAAAKDETKWVTLAPHQTREWTESPQENPVLDYKPGCAQCSYPGESEYQVVFAYAYIASGGLQPGQLTCGLRSAPVPMPPKN